MPAPRFYWIARNCYGETLPPVTEALEEPDGLLAAGGDLAPSTLITAYAAGVFPWYSAGQPILWWSPDPRAVFRPEAFHVSRSLARTLRRERFDLTLDQAFGAVIEACGSPRRDAAGTWITPEMIAAYTELHRLGHAHSVECWQDGQLVGGVYGVAIGRVFFGESMFSRVTDASKVALVHLCRWLGEWGYTLFDCQVVSAHLRSLGAIEMPRAVFTETLRRSCVQSVAGTAWRESPAERAG